MKSRVALVTAAWCLSLLLTATPALADRGGHGYQRGYGHPHGYWRERGGHRHYGHRRHHGGHEGAYLLGGIVIGTVIGQALAPRPAYGYPAYSQRTYVERAPYGEPAVSRRLYRDLDGNCFERRFDSRGRETLLALPDYECAW